MVQQLLIVDDEKPILNALSKVLGMMENVKVHTANNAKDALKICEQIHPSVVITDLKMPEMDGIELLEKIQSLNESIQTIMITGHGTINDAVNAMKKGAVDFIQKPFKKQQIISVVQRVIDKAQLLDENRTLKEQLRKRSAKKYIWGNSQEFQKVLQRASQAAVTDATILILGESGTGKEALANHIVDQSARCDRPFVKVNCAAIPSNLLEAELFGYKKGSFTGAVADHPGKFQEASGGTIFLDEIGEIPLEIQSKLLRVLQEGEVNPVGGATELVNVRIIAATNRNLKEEVLEGKFREDLYYRLNVVPLTIPPLREHGEDIPTLVSFFVKKYSRKLNKPNVSVSKPVMDRFEEYHWPGNIRELENVIERAVIFSEGGKIQLTDLPDDLLQMGNDNLQMRLDQGMTLEEIETQVIRMALERNQWDKKRVANQLGISLRTIYRKLDRI